MSNSSGGDATDVQDRPTDGAGGSGPLRDQAEQAAGAAADESKHVASVVGEEAQKVAQETRQQAQDLIGEARSQLVDQARVQQDRLVQMLGSVGDDLDRMSGESTGIATDLVRQAAEQVRGISGRLDGREPTDVLEDVRRFAKQRPGTFLLGALTAGLVAGRFARGLQQSQNGSSAGRVPTQPTPSPAPAQHADPATTEQVRTTPQAGAMADFPADRPGGLS